MIDHPDIEVNNDFILHPFTVKIKINLTALVKKIRQTQAVLKLFW